MSLPGNNGGSRRGGTSSWRGRGFWNGRRGRGRGNHGGCAGGGGRGYTSFSRGRGGRGYTSGRQDSDWGGRQGAGSCLSGVQNEGVAPDPTNRQPRLVQETLVNCPFPAWGEYFPGQAYSPGSRHSEMVQAFMGYFRKHWEEYSLDDVGMQCALAVDAASLLQDSALNSSHPDLVEMLKDQPETCLGCMGLALHTLLSVAEPGSSTLAASSPIREAQVEGNSSGSPNGSSTLVLEEGEERREIAGPAARSEEGGECEDLPRLYIRLYNFGPVIPLKNIKAPLFGKCVEVQGTVVRVSNIKPMVTTLAFSCSLCRSTQALMLTDGKYSLPNKCSNPECRSRTFVPQRSSPLTQTIDRQTIKIQELAEDDRREAGRIPRTMECELTSDLVDSCIPGDMVTITAIVKATNSEEAGHGRNSKDKCMFVLYLQAVSVVTNKGQGGSDPSPSSHAPHMEFSTKDYYAISEIHSDKDVFKLIVGSFCPAIYGHELVKAGLVLGLFGGTHRQADPQNTVPIRGDPHILVVGDPGLGKSQMLQAASRLAPRGVYVCGSTTTTSGLTVTLSKESGGSGDLALEAGALVLADQGCCCIDEFDKMGSQHQALLEAMEQQSISIAKAGVLCSLPARTAILAAANPVGGHYNKAKTVSENLKMSGALLSRFDLVFILLDRPDKEMDSLLSEHVMSQHSNKGGRSQRTDPDTTAGGSGVLRATASAGGSGVLRATARRTREGSIETSLDHSSSLLLMGDDETDLRQRLKVNGKDFDPIPVQLLRKYIGYARKYVHPKIGEEAGQVLQKFYLELRNQRERYDSTPITTRQLESLIRLTEARARLSLREEASGEDAREVVQIMKFSMSDTFSDEFGLLDFDRSQHGCGMRQRAQGKRFVHELSRIADLNGSSSFTVQQMREIGKNIGIQMSKFEDLVCSLNNQNYLLKKGPKLYQLQTANCL